MARFSFIVSPAWCHIQINVNSNLHPDGKSEPGVQIMIAIFFSKIVAAKNMFAESAIHFWGKKNMTITRKKKI